MRDQLLMHRRVVWIARGISAAVCTRDTVFSATSAVGEGLVRTGCRSVGGPIHEGIIKFRKRTEAVNSSSGVQGISGRLLRSEGENVGLPQADVTGPLEPMTPICFSRETPEVFLSEMPSDRVMDGGVDEKIHNTQESAGMIDRVRRENGFCQPGTAFVPPGRRKASRTTECFSAVMFK